MFESLGPNPYALTQPDERLYIIDFFPRRSDNEVKHDPNKPYLSRIFDPILSS